MDILRDPENLMLIGIILFSCVTIVRLRIELGRLEANARDNAFVAQHG